MNDPVYKKTCIDNIYFDEKNVRSDYRSGLFNADSDDIKALAESILEFGLIEPIIVSQIENNKFNLIAGERRLRALQLININYPDRMREITVKVYDGITDERKKMIQLIENVQRKDLSDYDKVIAIFSGYEMLSKQIDPETGKKYTQRKYASLIGMSPTNLSNYLTYTARPVIIECLRIGIMGLGAANMCLPFDDFDIETYIVKKVKDERINGNPYRVVVASDFRELEQAISQKEHSKNYDYIYQIIDSNSNSLILNQQSINARFGTGCFLPENEIVDSYTPSLIVSDNLKKHRFSKLKHEVNQNKILNHSLANLNQISQFDQQNFLINIDKAKQILSKFYPDVEQLDGFQVFDRFGCFLIQSI